MPPAALGLGHHVSSQDVGVRLAGARPSAGYQDPQRVKANLVGLLFVPEKHDGFGSLKTQHTENRRFYALVFFPKKGFGMRLFGRCFPFNFFFSHHLMAKKKMAAQIRIVVKSFQKMVVQVGVFFLQSHKQIFQCVYDKYTVCM